ncbi:MAG: short-chain dehydrogenase/reductase [Sulfurimonas sp. RIFOXYD12_FULL_33_39]|uniref:SDR family oxidoreductase n=1 Tax=unclassified Sulfurimonas TaxID=2623549 RepID=UPI0008B387AF|nr:MULTISPECIES: SDR family oxidoreductase [unclassified Sulfurimonas]OHE05398.1 MAG: short-chain dehydrogenase/reductase [Sulfurimonas sp. RIFCSPLOWO2_12_FULL_34_6]OHE09872.1 MAG: short-chain dehydrogenase/reductase [Sulfurimonas sp. RIFOXYD12_FULL_33_39]OHE13620.1 MAG: short-chain dehydrogenase/reductase [Sulfurimonas sp. RIFOXYD2_FULL_34_21]DAB27348.1 MAG TPA: short-chain dehydrogenase/reductase [Sulfurimonas sp. UBA10385]
MSKVVLITGATSGMGELSAKFLADSGYIVYAGSRDENVKSGDSNLKHVYIDVTKTATIKSAVDTIIKKEGKIDVLVNNAGYGLLATLEDGTDDEIFNQFDVNVFGLIKTTREVLPHMREAKSGVIINLSSFLGKMGLPLLSCYNASKYAVEGITDSLRFETLPFNVRVHSIESGLFGTNFVKKGLVANAKTTSEDSPYKELVSHFVPIVAKAINEGPNPQPIADAIKHIIENEDADIAIAVGAEAKAFVPLRKELSDKDFEKKIKDTFGI